VVERGTPARLMGADLIAQVFDVEAEIITDPVPGRPLCIPLGRPRPAETEAVPQPA